MADSVGYTPGFGADIAVDDVDGILYQKVKLVSGPDGVANDITDGTPLNVNATNATTKLRDAFEKFTPGAGENWTINSLGNAILALEGNTASASYLTLSLDPIAVSSESVITGNTNIKMPFDVSFGASLSQRSDGQYFALESVSTDTDTDVTPLVPPTPVAIASIQQATTTLTVTTATPHGLLPGQIVTTYNVSDSRLNYPYLVVATIPTSTQFTVTAGAFGNIPSVTAGPFSSGSVLRLDPLGSRRNGSSIIFNNTTATNASFYTRSEGGTSLPSGTITGNHNATIASTASVALVSAAFTYAWSPTTTYSLLQQLENTSWYDVAVDTSSALPAVRYKRGQVVPNPIRTYNVRLRAANLAAMSRPVAKIVSAVKTGTTTATINTDVAHGLTTGDVVNIVGVRDQSASAFPNLTTATAVASTPTATSFTIVIGSASTTTSYGGYVARVNGGRSIPGQITQVVQSVARTNNVLTVTGNGSWAGFSVGDFINLYGVRDNLTGADLGVDGAYRVANVTTTTLVAEPITDYTNTIVSPTGPDIVNTNAGGAVLRRTDLRLSFLRIIERSRLFVEPPFARNDVAMSLPVNVTNSISGGTISTVSTVTNGNLGFPSIIADVASAAITSTATTSAITPTFGVSYSVVVPVTASGGTTPTLDITVEESDDSGTNWYPVYSFPRITGTGIWRSPQISFNGNRIRYVQTVTGSGATFTRSIQRLQASEVITPIRQLIDRTISLTTLSSTTPALIVSNCRNVGLVINIGAASTPPALEIQGSDDGGVSWYTIGTALTAVANSTVVRTVNNVHAERIRAIISSAGTTVTAGYVLIKGF